jgi:hypothetical protein
MNASPPKIHGSGHRLPMLILGALFLAGGVVLFFFNPSTHHFYPECQFHRLTGLNCPGCGMTRAAYALLHGEFASAVRDNALLVGLLAWFTLRSGRFGLNRWRGRPNGEFFPARCLWILLGLMLAFTILRNLPAFAFLAP